MIRVFTKGQLLIAYQKEILYQVSQGHTTFHEHCRVIFENIDQKHPTCCPSYILVSFFHVISGESDYQERESH